MNLTPFWQTRPWFLGDLRVISGLLGQSIWLAHYHPSDLHQHNVPCASLSPGEYIMLRSTQFCCVLFCFDCIICVGGFWWVFISIFCGVAIKLWSVMVSQRTPLIARFMGPTWDPPGADRAQVGPCWPHELCYLGHDVITSLLHQNTVAMFLIATLHIQANLSWSVFKDQDLVCKKCSMDDLLLFEVCHPITNVTETWQAMGSCVPKTII